MAEYYVDGRRYRRKRMSWRYGFLFLLVIVISISLASHWFVYNRFNTLRDLHIKQAKEVLALLQQKVGSISIIIKLKKDLLASRQNEIQADEGEGEEQAAEQTSEQASEQKVADSQSTELVEKAPIVPKIKKIRGQQKPDEKMQSQIQALVEQLQKNHPYIKQLTFVSNTDNKYIADTQVQFTIPNKVKSLFENYYSHPEDIKNSQLILEKKSLGKMAVTLNVGYRQYQVWRDWLEMVSYSGGLAFILFLFYLYILSRCAIPLRALVNSAERILDGERSLKIRQQGAGEVRTACHIFNAVAELVYEQDKKMRSVKQSLESELESATERYQGASLNQKNAEIANQSKSRYLENISEEFRQPLNNILSLSEMLLKPEYKNQQRHFIDMIHASTLHLNQFIDDMMDIAQYESNELSVNKAVLNFRQVLEEAQNQAMVYALKNEKIVTTVIDSDIPELAICDHRRLKQVCILLVCNAIESGEGNRVNLKAQVEKTDVLSVSIIINIYSDSHESSDEFIQASRGVVMEQSLASSCDLYGKSGVALPVAKKIVSALGGGLVEDAYEEQQYSYQVKLRLERPTQGQIEKMEQQNDHLGKVGRRPLKILLAESSLINRYVFELVFLHRGFVTIKADDGREALTKMEQGGIDCAILDLQMSKMSGLEVAKAWRGTKRKTHLPIIIISNDAKLETLEQCKAYADIVKIKPVSPYALIEQIENVILDKAKEETAEDDTIKGKQTVEENHKVEAVHESEDSEQIQGTTGLFNSKNPLEPEKANPVEQEKVDNFDSISEDSTSEAKVETSASESASEVVELRIIEKTSNSTEHLSVLADSTDENIHTHKETSVVSNNSNKDEKDSRSNPD